MSKDDLIDMQGTVVAVHSGGLYRVQCDAGHEVLAQLSGRMRRFRIKVVPGDRVTVGVSPYDPVRGIITFRATISQRVLKPSSAHSSQKPSRRGRRAAAFAVRRASAPARVHVVGPSRRCLRVRAGALRPGADSRSTRCRIDDAPAERHPGSRLARDAARSERGDPAGARRAAT